MILNIISVVLMWLKIIDKHTFRVKSLIDFKIFEF